jgi:nucleotide-binding universal stress UspA family protein
MLSIQHILYPTDFSEGAARAFPQAAFLADWHDAELHILNVTGRHEHDHETARDHFPVSLDTLTDWLHGPAGSAAGTSRIDLSALTITQEQVESAVPAEQILDYAEGQAIDLIVMGTHGRRGVDRMLFGSVAEEVVRKAPCPTLTVRKDVDRPPSKAVRRVLAPIDFSNASEVAVQHAKEIALTYGAEVDLLHVVQEPVYPSAYGYEAAAFPTAEVIDSVEAQLGEMAREQIGYEHVMIEARTGDPGGQILDYTAENEIDLIVIATHGRTGLNRMLLGSVAERVLRRSPVPVFIVKPDQNSLVPAPTSASAATPS